MGGAAIDRSHEKSGLVNVRVVVLGIFVPNRPLLRVPQPQLHIRASFVEDSAVDEESGFVRTDRKCELPVVSRPKDPARSRRSCLRLVESRSASGRRGWIPGSTRFNIPDLYFADGSVGMGDAVGQATALPSSIASAATWDLND
jgi:hypothetical protein